MAAPVVPIRPADEEISVAELGEGIKALDDSYEPYKTAHDYYCGDIDEFFDSIKLKKKLRDASRAYNINFASIPVDAVAERLKIASITAEDEDASRALQQHWDDNLMGLFSTKAMHGVCELGDYYVIAWPREVDDEGRALVLDTWINDPRQCRILYDEERPLIKRFMIKRWKTSGTVRVDLYFPDRIEKLVSRKGTDGKQPADFDVYRDEDSDPWPYDNPTGEVPGFHLRNDAPYGVPEHERFYGTQNVLIKLIVSHMGSVDYNMLPQRYALAESTVGQADASAIDPDLFSVDGAGAEVDEEVAQLDSRPGGLWDLKGKKAVGQFDAAPPAVFTEPMVTYLRFGAQLSGTPVYKIDPSGQVESGESRRMADGSLTHKVGSRQEWLESAWLEYARFVLRLLGYEDVPVTVRWEPAETTDDETSWRVAQAKIDAGVPVQQVFVEMGYDPDQVRSWFEDFDPDTERGADLLLKIGQALTALGTAANLSPEVVTPDLVRTLIAAVLEEDENGDE